MRNSLLIARTVLIEAVRRKEIYAIVAISLVLIGAVATTQFFGLSGLGKFFREIALKVMAVATNLTVIVMAARQLPREFEARTVYPLLAKPVSRFEFIAGKLLGVMAAGAFCFLLFMIVFVGGSMYIQSPVNFPIFAQFLYLQVLSLLIVANLGFMLSLLANLDAAITVSAIYYATGNLLMNAITFLHDGVGQLGKILLLGLLVAIPQITLLDLSGKVVHEEAWPPLALRTMTLLTCYAGFYSAGFFAVSLALFRRRPL